MNWYRNLEIKTKLTTAFIIVIALTIVVAIVGVIGLTSVANTYTHLIDYPSERRALFAEAEFYLTAARRDYVYLGMLSGDVPELNERLAVAENTLKQFTDALTRCRQNLMSDPRASQSLINERSTQIDTMLSDAQHFRDDGLIPMYNLMITGNATHEEGLAQLNEGTAIASAINTMISEVLEQNIATVKETNDASTATESSIRITLIVISVITAFISVVIALFVASLISKPLVSLSGFMEKASTTGDIILEESHKRDQAKYASNDETGQVIKNCSAFIEHVTMVSQELDLIADGDLSIAIKTISDRDKIGKSLEKMVDKLNNMFTEINSASVQVSTGAKQVADGAQSLAQGATEQSSSIESLSHTLNEISKDTKDKATVGTDMMGQMVESVGNINQASNEISKIIKVIDDIAFQTNILALNASVEAARAGAHGKGFAVVAEEVKNLANRSQTAARETNQLIENSLRLADAGTKIAHDTQEALESIVGSIDKLSDVMNGIEQISIVVQQNSATAQESAAASQEMSSQSTTLQELISQFKLKSAGSSFRSLPETNKFSQKRTSPQPQSQSQPRLQPQPQLHRSQPLQPQPEFSYSVNSDDYGKY